MKTTQFISFCLILFFALNASAELSKTVTQEQYERLQKIKKNAKLRLYVGGRDEADIKVQTHLYKPTRKIIIEEESSNEPEEMESE